MKSYLVILGFTCFMLEFGAVFSQLNNIEARYGVISNPYGGSYQANVTLTNRGDTAIDTANEDVTVYLCLIRLVLNSNKENGTQVSTSPEVTVYHLDGCAHKVVFSAPFQLAAGESISITLTQQFWLVAYTDVMQNWYIQQGNGEHQLIENTDQDQTEFVDPFDTERKYLRSDSDLVLPLTPKKRYDEQEKLYQVEEIEVKTRLVPDVFDSLDITADTKYTAKYDTSSQLPITYLTDDQLEKDQFKIMVEADGDITMTLSANTTAVRNIALSTLTQMLERFDDTLPVGAHMSKPPRYGYRGFMLDLSRQFHNKEVVKRQLDLMWRYKLNHLHLHLIDDESWALEIEDIPELTMYGSRQCFNLEECATYPQLGRQISGNNEFLSKADYVEIVEYAESLGITVIPEVELPGHSTAAIQAMKIRYDKDPSSVDYRLHDPQDTSEYISVQYFTEGAMNPCVDSMFAFVRKVIENIQRYHNEAGQPLRIIHVAGDEVAGGAWVDSPACASIISNLGENATNAEKNNAIKIEMTKKLGVMAEDFGVSLAFWHDGLINRTDGKPMIKDDVFPASVDVYSYIWQTVWEWSEGDQTFNMANGGYKVIMSPATHFYLDHPHEPHPRERGYYWAVRSANLRTAFKFRPENYYANIDGITRFGLPSKEKFWCDPISKCPPLEKRENIVGVEAPLFGETIQNQDHIDNNAYPRLLAVAERGWNEGAWEKLSGENPDGLQQDLDWFRQSVEEYEIPALERKHNVKYHLSPPGAMVMKDEGSMQTLQLSVEFKGQSVQWRMESSDQFSDVTDNMLLEYKKGDQIYLRTRNGAGSRFSYEIPYYSKVEEKGSTTVSTTTTSNGSRSALNVVLALVLSIAISIS